LLVFEEELEVTLAELEESNCNLASLKAQRDAAKGAFFPILNQGNKHIAGDRVKDKQKDLHDMESTLKELMVISLNWDLFVFIHSSQTLFELCSTIEFFLN
jgi:hypothetical protein